MPLERHPANPILTRKDIPGVNPRLADPSSVFNPGAIRHDGKIRLMLRVQSRGRETFLLMAESDDGVRLAIADRPVALDGIEKVSERVYHVYDPRLTRLDGAGYAMFAMDLDGGCRLGLARTPDFASYEFLGIVSDDDVRNGVLFPEKVGGRYLRLERPNRATPGGPPSGTRIRLAASDDLLRWESVATVIEGRPHYWDERIGSGPPPVKTRAGWLHLYHGVATHFDSVNIYQAGALLLDLEDPSRVIARTHNNILEPREPYELTGQVPNVVFPSGMVVEQVDDEGFARDSSRVLVYYGAADTSVGLAFSTVGQLLADCKE